MNPINERQRRGLERKFGAVCPSNAQISGTISTGVLPTDELDVVLFYCSVDHGAARGGLVVKVHPTGAIRPCSFEYARRCPLYSGNADYTSEKGGYF